MKAQRERIARAELIGQMRAMIDKSKRANKDFTSLERERYEAMTTEFDRLDARINKLEATGPQLDEIGGANNLSQLGTDPDVMRRAMMSGGVLNSASSLRSGNQWARRPNYADDEDHDHARAFSAYLRGGLDSMPDDMRAVLRQKWLPNLAGILSPVKNTMSTTTGSQGGSISGPCA